MPLGQFIVESVIDLGGQLAMEMGGEAIHKRYGWKGCVVAVCIIVAIIAVVIWLLTR